MKQLILFFCLLSFYLNYAQSQFRVDYNLVAGFDFATEEWSEWEEGYNTFVFNYNENNDVLHIKPNGQRLIYRKLSSIEKETTQTGEHYQIMFVLGEDGETIKLQLFDNTNIGLKLMWENFIIQFAKN